MPKLNWDGNDFRNSQDSSGTVADNISRSGNLQQGYDHGSLTRGLVAYYPMEKGQGQIIHDAAFDNIGQIKGANWNETGKIGSNAIKFNGTGENVRIGDISADTLESWTVAYWAMPFSSQSDSSTWSGLVSNGDANNDGDWSCHYKHDVTDWVITHSGDYPYNSGLNVTANALLDQWQLVVWTYDGSKIRIYRDGELKDSSSGSQTYDSSTDNLNIGKYIWNGDDRYWNGQIEDVRIYNRALSQPEIQALTTLSQPSGVQRLEKSVPGQSEGGISRYKLDGDATDSWGDNNGTSNSLTFKTGVYNQAGDFDGSSSYIDTPNIGINDANSPASFSTWVKFNDASGNQILVEADDSSQKVVYYLYVKNGNLIFYRDDGTNNGSVTGPSPNTGQWYHVVGTHDGNGNIKLYVNGSLEDSNSMATGGSRALEDTGIGRREYGNDWYFNGKIDDVRIYEKALTPLQVEKLYHKGAYRISRESTLQ